MFLHLLNEDQQRAALALTRQFIEADAHLHDEERNLLELMYAESGLDFDTELPGGGVADLISAFDTKQARSAVLLELIGVGHADEAFSPEENAFVREVADGLGVSAEEVRAMENWVRKQLQLAQEAEGFWRE